jgi:hypothetical protein
MPKLKRREFWLKMVAEQQAWIAKCGGDLFGYIQNYTGIHKRTEEQSKAIFDADFNALKEYERKQNESR